ncbi:MAG TPA: hypothetical protein VFN67_12760 [Polyangiales bacterium]|nr:hypothetical protein [Polyangiales bacterium]
MTPDQAWWQSGLDTGSPEWLQLDYGAAVKVLPTAVRAYIVNGRDGNPTFQGSNDGTSWTELGTYHSPKFAFNGSPYNGWGTYVDTFSASNNTGYRYLRVYSAGAPYLNYAWLSFDGVVTQR